MGRSPPPSRLLSTRTQPSSRDDRKLATGGDVGVTNLELWLGQCGLQLRARAGGVEAEEVRGLLLARRGVLAHLLLRDLFAHALHKEHTQPVSQQARTRGSGAQGRQQRIRDNMMFSLNRTQALYTYPLHHMRHQPAARAAATASHIQHTVMAQIRNCTTSVKLSFCSKRYARTATETTS